MYLPRDPPTLCIYWKIINNAARIFERYRNNSVEEIKNCDTDASKLILLILFYKLITF